MPPRRSWFTSAASRESRRREQLAQFQRRLADLQAGRLQRLTILQIGDSHTEAEHFSGHLRTLFQGRFGNGGRGMLAPGSPVAYWRPSQVRAEQSGKWQVFTSNKTDHADLPFGLSGFVVRGSSPTDVMTLAAADDSAGFDTVEIGYYRKPDGGTIELTVDGKAIGEIATRDEILCDGAAGLPARLGRPAPGRAAPWRRRHRYR